MSVKNVTGADLALLELLAGTTAAPREVLDGLASRGHLTISAGQAALTPKGRRRAEKLKPIENDLRLCFSAKAGKRSALTTDGGTGFSVGGGPARIRA
jgi:hypothetical protein